MTGERVREEIDVGGTPEQYLAVITDFASYPEWEKNTKKREVRETDEQGRGTKVWFEFRTPVKTVAYTVGYDYSGFPRSISFNLLGGDIKEFDGTFEFRQEGDTTHVSFDMGVHPGFPIPGIIKRQLERQQARSTLQRIKAKVEAPERATSS